VRINNSAKESSAVVVLRSKSTRLWYRRLVNHKGVGLESLVKVSLFIIGTRELSIYTFLTLLSSFISLVGFDILEVRFSSGPWASARLARS